MFPPAGSSLKNQESIEAWATGSPRNTHKVTPGLTGTPVRLWMDQYNGWSYGERDILYFVDGFRAGHGMGEQGGHGGGERARRAFFMSFQASEAGH